MAKNPPDERLVYLALKGVFQGNDAELRREKKVRKLIQKHQNQAEIRNLIQEHNIDSLCHVAKVLLEEQVFGSTLKAKMRFPEVFEVSPSQTAERAISESEAAKNEDAAIQCVTEGHQGESSRHESKLATSGDGKGAKIGSQDNSIQSRGYQHSQPKTAAASLYPVYLPFDVQHRLVAKVQHTLEKACYLFAQKKLGGVLQREGWDCAEAVELNRWPKVFLAYQDEFNSLDLMELGKPLPDLLNSISQLRHAAVHRLRLTANRVLQFIIDAESLVKLFQDDNFIYMISTIRRQTQGTIEELERNKDLLESRLAETRRQFAARRAELERQECEAMENTVKEDRDYTVFAGANLEQALDTPTTVIHSRASTEDERSSDADFDERSADEAGPSRKYMD